MAIIQEGELIYTQKGCNTTLFQKSVKLYSRVPERIKTSNDFRNLKRSETSTLK